jgi:hypothetical protein
VFRNLNIDKTGRHGFQPTYASDFAISVIGGRYLVRNTNNSEQNNLDLVIRLGS